MVAAVGEEEAPLSEYSPLVAALRVHRARARQWHDRLPDAAAGGASLQQFLWAMSVRRWHPIRR